MLSLQPEAKKPHLLGVASMIALALLVLVVGFAFAASRSIRHGLGRLWLTTAGAILVVGVSTALLGRYYSVPHPAYLLVYVGALTGPVVLVPAGLPTW